MELSQLLTRTAPLTIPYFTDKIEAVVYTDRMSPKKRAELIELVASEDESRKDEQVLILSEVIASWDSTMNGEPFPPTYENIEQLSFPLLSHILRAVSDFLGERARPTKQTS